MTPFEPADAHEPASVHLHAELRERRHRGIRRLVHYVALAASEYTGGPSMADLVVTRRDSGAEVLRTSAGPLDGADELLRALRADLDRMSVAEFLEEWGHLR